jgi:hypothetical protein
MRLIYNLVFILLLTFPTLGLADFTPKLSQGGTNNNSFTSSRCVRTSTDGTKLESSGTDCALEINGNSAVDCTGATDSRSSLQTFITANAGKVISFTPPCTIKLSGPGADTPAITLPNDTVLHCKDSSVVFKAEGRVCGGTSTYPGAACSDDSDCYGGGGGSCAGTQFAPTDSSTYIMISVASAAVSFGQKIINCTIDAHQVDGYYSCETDSGFKNSCRQECSGLLAGFLPVYCKNNTVCTPSYGSTCVGNADCSGDCTGAPNNPAGTGNIIPVRFNSNPNNVLQQLDGVRIRNHREGAASVAIGSSARIIDLDTTVLTGTYSYLIGDSPLPTNATILVTDGVTAAGLTHADTVKTFGATSALTVGSGSVVIDAKLTGSATGLIASGDDTYLTDGTVTVSGVGVRLIGSRNVVQNYSITNGTRGIWASGSTNRFLTNYITGPSQYGITSYNGAIYSSNTIIVPSASVGIGMFGATSIASDNDISGSYPDSVGVLAGGPQQRIVGNDIRTGYGVLPDLRGRCDSTSTGNTVGEPCSSTSTCGGVANSCDPANVGNVNINNNRFWNLNGAISEAIQSAAGGYKIENNYFNRATSTQRRCGSTCANNGVSCTQTNPALSDAACGTCLSTSRQCIAPPIISVGMNHPTYGNFTVAHPIISGNLIHGAHSTTEHADIGFYASGKTCAYNASSNPLKRCTADADCGGAGGSCGAAPIAAEDVIISDNLLNNATGIGIDMLDLDGSVNTASNISIKGNDFTAGVPTGIVFPTANKLDLVSVISNIFDDPTSAFTNWSWNYGVLQDNIFFKDATKPNPTLAFLLNDTGAPAVSGDIVDSDTPANSFDLATVATRTFGVVQGDCAGGSVCPVTVTGVTTCNVPDAEAVSIGDPLKLSSTAGKAKTAASGDVAFGVALSAHSAGGDPDEVRCALRPITGEPGDCSALGQKVLYNTTTKTWSCANDQFTGVLSTTRFDFGSTSVPNPTYMVFSFPPNAGTVTRINCEVFDGTSLVMKICNTEDTDGTCSSGNFLDSTETTTITCNTSGANDTTINTPTLTSRQKGTIVFTTNTGNVTKGEVVIEGTIQ